MYAASGMRNTMAIATVIVQAAAIRATASPRPSIGASSCARNARNGIRRSTRLTRVAMLNLDRCRHADMHRLGQQERSGERQHVPSGARTSAAALSIEHIHAAILRVAAGAEKPPFGGGVGCRDA